MDQNNSWLAELHPYPALIVFSPDQLPMMMLGNAGKSYFGRSITDTLTGPVRKPRNPAPIT